MNSEPTPQDKHRRSVAIKVIVMLLVGGLAIVGCFFLGDFLTLKQLAEQESRLRSLQREQPLLAYGAAFLFYVAVTGLSLPGAAVLTIAYGWYWGLLAGVLLVSLASTTGATLAFLISRFLFHDYVQRRFEDRLRKFNMAWKREGPWFLFTLRLIPAVPFFVINAVMGLTPIRAWTFAGVSLLGMLPGTAVYVYAGSRVPRLQELADEGLEAVFTPGQLTQILVAFILLGTFPWLVRLGLRWFSGKQRESGAESTLS